MAREDDNLIDSIFDSLSDNDSGLADNDMLSDDEIFNTEYVDDDEVEDSIGSDSEEFDFSFLDNIFDEDKEIGVSISSAEDEEGSRISGIESSEDSKNDERMPVDDLVSDSLLSELFGDAITGSDISDSADNIEESVSDENIMVSEKNTVDNSFMTPADDILTGSINEDISDEGAYADSNTRDTDAAEDIKEIDNNADVADMLPEDTSEVYTKEEELGGISEMDIFNIDEMFMSDSSTDSNTPAENNQEDSIKTETDITETILNSNTDNMDDDLLSLINNITEESSASKDNLLDDSFLEDNNSEDIFSIDNLMEQFNDTPEEGQRVSEFGDINPADASFMAMDIATNDSSEPNTESEEPQKAKKQSLLKRLFGNIPEDISEEEIERRKNKVYADAEAKEKAEAEKAEKAAAAKEKKAADKKAAIEEKKVKKAEAEKLKAQKKKEALEKKAAKKDAKLKREKEIAEQIQEIENNEGRINRIGAGIVFALFIAFGIFLVSSTDTYAYSLNIKLAEEHFEVKEYDEAYESISGLDLKEEDRELYYKIRNVMYVNKQLNSYNNYYSLGMYSEALDSLLKGLKRYEQYYTIATIYDIVEDFDYVRDKLLYELESLYGISEEEAEDIINISDQTVYSLEVYERASKLYR